jgi:hypothetical protein
MIRGKGKIHSFLIVPSFSQAINLTYRNITVNCRHCQLIVNRLVDIHRELVVGYPWGQCPGMEMLAFFVAFGLSFRKSPGNDTLGLRLEPYWSRISLSSWEKGVDRVQLWGSPGRFGREGSISALPKGTIINFQVRSKSNKFEGSSRDFALRTEHPIYPTKSSLHGPSDPASRRPGGPCLSCQCSTWCSSGLVSKLECQR